MKLLKANELRIGNLVRYNRFVWHVYTIELKMPNKSMKYNDKDIVTLALDGLITATVDEIEPIPLTEEWLLRFGLTCPKGDVWFFDGFEQFWFQDLDGLEPGLNYCMGFNNEWTGVSVKYVHQLQNLYFALTGEELTLKEQQNETNH